MLCRLFRQYAVSVLVCFALSHRLHVEGTTCQTPACFGPTFTHPMATNLIPQMVYFGFDDAVTAQVASFYDDLFSEERTNPNGCRMKMSLYVSHSYTDYVKVKHLYDQGHEIGVHSVTHSTIDSDTILHQEAMDQRQNLVNAGVPVGEIVGWRSPFLNTAGENQPTILKGLGYTYDISLTYTIVDHDSPKPWPFTMQNGWPYNCGIQPCPVHTSITDFWTVPVVALMDKNNAYPCAYVDGCTFQPTDTDEAFTYLWNNFMSYYNTSRAPFGLNMHAAWFVNRPHNLEATRQFLTKLMTDFDDVYVVSVKQVLDWMRNPTSIADLNTLASWQCGQSDAEDTSSSSSTTTSTSTSTTMPTTTSSSTTMPTTTSTPTSTTLPTTPSTSTSTTLPTTTSTSTSTTLPTTTSTSTTASTTSTTSSGSGCRAAGAYANTAGMDAWCIMNCAAIPPYCPSTHCVCNT